MSMKITAFLLILACIFTVSCLAEEGTSPTSEQSYALADMSIEDLLALRTQIDNVLQQKGYAVYFDLERGSKGENVSSVQRRLTELGYYAGKLTGKYDTETQKAFKQFEKANGLESDGNAAIVEQQLLFSDAAIAKQLEPTPSPKPKATAEPEEYSAYQVLDYTQLARYPDDHKGSKVKLMGKVVQVLGNKTFGFQLRLATSGSDDIIYVTTKGSLEYNILENDRLTVYATMTGTRTYETIFGQSITIPSAYADEIILRS